MVKLAHLIPVFPFLAFLANIFFGRRLGRLSSLISISASSISLYLSALTFFAFLKGAAGSYTLGNWLKIGAFSLDAGVIVDPLTCMMLLVVTVVGTLIQVYSIGYMRADPMFSRYFAYISLFMASMLGLVLSDNLLMLYMFWEGVGLCSYLLISFWFERPAACRAGMKAFITTKIGDIGLLFGIFILFLSAKTIYFKDLSAAASNMNQFLPGIAAILIFCGAIGKSAQFPLHVWLPDAMEGPTSVSALIHAATMVAAGVYLVARTYGLFLINHFSLDCVAYIGALTSLMAASIAAVNNDIKRVLAYSTISQLGLMMLGLGVGGFSAGAFHLMTHAFFKALLFLCAGSIIHSAHTQDIRRLGGLLPKMKVTASALIIGALAISGIPPLSGFWSKDEILSSALMNGHPVLFILAAITSLLTSFYMFRLIFLTLYARSRSETRGAESGPAMTIPLSVLAVCSIFAGFIGSPFMGHAFQGFIHFAGNSGREELGPNYLVMAISAVIAFCGLGLAYLMYVRNEKILALSARRRLSWLYKLASNKYYLDEIYAFLFIRPCMRISLLLYKFDMYVIDDAVMGVSGLARGVSRVKSLIDVRVIDGFVNGIANAAKRSSLVLRRVQTGSTQNYLLIKILGLLIILLTKITVLIILWRGKL